MALLAGAIGVYFLLSYDWTASAGEVRPAAAHRPGGAGAPAGDCLAGGHQRQRGGQRADSDPVPWPGRAALGHRRSGCGLLLVVAGLAWLAGLAALVLTTSRGAWLGVGAGLLAMGYLLLRRRLARQRACAPGARSAGHCGDSIGRGGLLGCRAFTRRRAGTGHRAGGRQRHQPGDAVARWLGPGGRLPVHRQWAAQHDDGLLHLWPAAARGLYLPHAQPVPANRRRARRSGFSGLRRAFGCSCGQRAGRHAARPSGPGASAWPQARRWPPLWCTAWWTPACMPA